MENKIELLTKVNCQCGKKIAQVFQKMYVKHNGIIGPGSRTSSWIESEYYCLGCGLVYRATANNRLSFEEKERQDGANYLIKNTIPQQLVRNLSTDEAFLVVHKKNESLPVNNPDLFKKGEIVWLEFETNERRDPTELFPYIVPTKGKKKAKVVWWREYYYKDVPLPRSQNRQLQEEVADNKTKGRINKTSEIELKLFDVTTTRVMKKSKPLPDGAINLVPIYLKSMNYRVKVYVPKKTLTQVKNE